jgi:hypothetical protein
LEFLFFHLYRVLFVYMLNPFSYPAICRQTLHTLIIVQYIRLHVEFSLLFSDFNKNPNTSTDFIKISKTNFEENYSVRSRTISWGATDQLTVGYA